MEHLLNLKYSLGKGTGHDPGFPTNQELAKSKQEKQDSGLMAALLRTLDGYFPIFQRIYHAFNRLFLLIIKL